MARNRKPVCDYVRLNPLRAVLIAADQPLETYRWSSYGFYLQPPAKRPAWLSVGRLFGEWGIPKDSASGREEFAGFIEQRRAADLEGEFRPVRRGWYLGGDEFRKELLAQVSE